MSTVVEVADTVRFGWPGETLRIQYGHGRPVWSVIVSRTQISPLRRWEVTIDRVAACFLWWAQ